MTGGTEVPVRLFWGSSGRSRGKFQTVEDFVVNGYVPVERPYSVLRDEFWGLSWVNIAWAMGRIFLSTAEGPGFTLTMGDLVEKDLSQQTWKCISEQLLAKLWGHAMTTLIVQKWEEKERGWGSRPDGYSLHLSSKDRDAYIKAYWAGMPDEVPDEYSAPDGQPYLWDAPDDVVEKLRACIKAHSPGGDEEGCPEDVFGERIHNNNFPGSQGTDGWKSDGVKV